ncbi:BglG family transcription antiterminator [Ectobacillus funiculus]|uniref:BglG family transcription antiterminator n=1 Tax=Ectobacillus funiculus TaxID=137993 RepID=UPI00397E68E4
MQLDDRSNCLLQEVITNPGIKNKDLEEKYGLSRRQIGYSFDKINDWLEINNLPRIERTRQGLFIVNPILFTSLHAEKEKAFTNQYLPSDIERAEMIVLLLLSRNEELSLFHFTSALDVSKNTILNDLKIAQNLIEPYKLKIHYSRQHGYSIEGNEFQKRKLLINVIQKILEMYNGQVWIQKLANITKEEIQNLHEQIEKVESKLNLKFTDEKMESMPYILSFVLRRIKQGKIINSFHIHYDELSDTKEYKATEELLYNWGDIPTEERLFVTLQLLTTNVSSSELLTEETIPDLIQAVDEMLRLFEKMACIVLQDKEQLLHKILLHVKPAYYRIKYKLTISNPLQETVSNEFKELHHLVKKSTKPLFDLIGSEIPESESTYFTMLIGGWLSRQGDSIHHKTKALVVCPKGVSVSRLMQSNLKELFPEFIFLDALSVREFQQYNLDYDVVFSPVFLQTKKKLFIVRSFLQKEEKYRLRKQVLQDLHGYMPSDIDVDIVLDIIEKHTVIQNKQALMKELQQYFTNNQSSSIKQQPETTGKPNLSELITPETISLHPAVSSWEEAIRLGAQPLLENESITPSYVEAMIKQYDTSDPYIIIGPNLAIPHASPEDGVNEVAMSLLRLEKGVDFAKDHPINIVVIIAARDKQQHLRALMQLTRLAVCKEDIDAMIQAKSAEEVHEIIEKYSVE